MYNRDSIQKLSDEQLINLFKSNGIDKSLKQDIINEIDRREIENEAVVQQSLSFKEKATIIFTSILSYKYHVKKATGILISGNKIGYKKYWTFFLFGIAMYFFLFLIISKYFLKPLFLK